MESAQEDPHDNCVTSASRLTVLFIGFYGPAWLLDLKNDEIANVRSNEWSQPTVEVMCGILGVLCRPERFSRAEIERAASTLTHRGPDDSGVEYFEPSDAWRLWLGHTRLSILDLSRAGHQPMVGRQNEGVRGAITFNGELYNFRQLRASLSDRWQFRSQSDTEVLLAGLLCEGPGFFEKTNAMLACGVYDEGRKRLVLGRDRMGKKPLYVYRGDDLLIFASELKAIQALRVPLTLDERALAFYRWLNYIPGRMTIYQECEKFPAGSFAEIDLSASELHPPQPLPYWDPLRGFVRRFEGSYDDAVDRLIELMDDAVGLRLVADVPVGAFLSGGIDSSLVVATAAHVNPSALTAFTVALDDPEHDEARIAIETSERLGIGIELLHMSPEDYRRQFDKIPWHYDEPLANRSQIAIMALAEAARKEGIKVVLGGDGGDEVFLGYSRVCYPGWLSRYRKLVDMVPGGRALTLRALEQAWGQSALGWLVRLHRLNVDNLHVKTAILQNLLSTEHLAEVYDTFQAALPKQFLEPRDRELVGSRSLIQHMRDWFPSYSWDAAEATTLPELLGALDLLSDLRDDLLVKIDRGTMAYGLEARSPFLDWRIVEFGCSLPLEYKIKDGVHKRISCDALARRLDGELGSVRKHGFTLPQPEGLPEAPTWSASYNRGLERAWRETNLVSRPLPPNLL